MRPAISLPGPPAWTYGVTVPTSPGASQLRMAPSVSRPASRSIWGRRARTSSRSGAGRRVGAQATADPADGEGLVALGHPLAGQGGPQEPGRVPDPRQGPVERDAVPALHHHLRGGAPADGHP